MKNLVPILLALFVFTFSACKIDPPEPPEFPEEPEVNYEFFLDDEINDAMSTKSIPGLAIGVIRDGAIDWEKGYGKANIENGADVNNSTSFLMSQAADLIVAATVHQVVQQGKIDLDEDINKYLPFKVKNPNFPNAVVTPRMLLAHSAGIKDNAILIQSTYTTGDSEESLEAFLEALLSEGGHFYQPGNFTTSRPGKTYSYSRTGIALLGYMVESATGIEFDIFCKTHVFAKMGLSNTSWFLRDLNSDKIATPYRNNGGTLDAVGNYGYAIYPSGQLRMNINQALKFVIALLRNGSYGSQRIMKPSFVEDMKTVQFPGASEGQGLAWSYETIKGRELLGISGFDTGSSTRIYIDPTINVGVVILSNGAGYDSSLDDILVRTFEVAETEG